MSESSSEQSYCEYCGKPLEYSGKGRIGIYCSGACRTAACRKRSAAENNEEEKAKPFCICAYCGKKFIPAKSISQKYCSGDCSTAAKTEMGRRIITKEDVRTYSDNPYVVSATTKRIELNDSFFYDAVPFIEKEDCEIFRIFELIPQNFSPRDRLYFRRLISEKKNISCRETVCSIVSRKRLRIMINRVDAMENIVKQSLRTIGEHIKEMQLKERKELCCIIRDFKKNPTVPFTTTQILDLINLTPNSYYSYIKNPDYGISTDAHDARDEKIVRQAFEYKGYPKGVRLVYMLIPKLNGKKIGLDRVRRIMRKYEMKCPIRKPNGYRQSAAERMKEYRQPNLLQRMFRLHRPNEVRLTDVTVIECANDFKAYGSALMDPVTGVLVAFEVSENNNLDLALETLRKADKHPCQDGGIFHSDQGTLYLVPTFQAEVESLGYQQSMSKRGNCWDNAPQESFFGHFKDECRDKYELCGSIDELRKVAEDYAFYYNNERGQWCRNHMTPLEYEAYLISLSDEEFSAYMEKETRKYENMKEEAKLKAIERFKTLGV